MSANSLGARAFVALQYLLPQHLLSRGVWLLTRSTWLKRPLVSAFMRGFKPDLRDALQSDPQRFASFNAFFTRALRDGTRPMPDDPLAIACPVDGTISMIGTLDDGLLMQAKGQNYTLKRLLADHGAWAERLTGGRFATIYLAPYNYHRIHMPMGGELLDAWYVPGRLFSVNATTAARVPGLFARNERVICGFGNQRGQFAVVLVGALFVGSMSTVWHGDVTPRRRRKPSQLSIQPGSLPARITRGAELGRFNMGSTVILLLPPGMAEWSPALRPGQVVRVGETIGRLQGASDA
jgi:phosphatidylserine decarboxylase